MEQKRDQGVKFERTIAFTLLELVIVVAVIAILSVIAIPNFLSAQTRAKVSGAKNNITVLADAAQVYRVDWNRYPPTIQRIPRDPYGIISDVQLYVLTTPLAYVSPAAFKDPFGKIRRHSFTALSFSSWQSRSDFPVPETPNPKGSLLYYNYHYFSDWTGNPWIDVTGIGLVSIGPDRKDSFGVFRPFPPEALPPLARKIGILHPRDTQYDPTNGAISSGDIAGFAGEVSLTP